MIYPEDDNRLSEIILNQTKNIDFWSEQPDNVRCSLDSHIDPHPHTVISASDSLLSTVFQ